jgi:hypothetical protein
VNRALALRAAQDAVAAAFDVSADGSA